MTHMKKCAAKFGLSKQGLLALHEQACACAAEDARGSAA